MDYLDRAVAGLTEGATPPSERDLKYAVLHLQAATEVLLKARLIGEHWSLLFRKISDADLEKFKRGDFDSCNTDETIDRLTKIAQVEISEKARDAIAKLAKDRNALMHYGHTGSAYVVEARAAQVLDFLLDFVNGELRPMLDGEFRKKFHLGRKGQGAVPPESVQQMLDSPDVQSVHRELQAVDETMGELRLKLGSIEKLVDKRMKDLAGELEAVKHRTVHCPDCRQMAFVINEDPEAPGPVGCRFCLFEVHNPEVAAIDYVWRVTGEDNGQLENCPVCKLDSLVLGAVTAEDKNEEIGLCFSCCATFEMVTSVGAALSDSDAEEST
ncbi:hypothetical protein [Streptomyces sp. G1]|uniref:hypothetical protein n=1 Tax=Streptomyces sp. G1 TaxID=361572 RepID=UPI0020300CCD|nr:hypothetical protein [Streptomyces sp. G1]MCM1973183.1 hypothetical protein [Streptomyces sp. G1]